MTLTASNANKLLCDNNTVDLSWQLVRFLKKTWLSRQDLWYKNLHRGENKEIVSKNASKEPTNINTFAFMSYK